MTNTPGDQPPDPGRDPDSPHPVSQPGWGLPGQNPPPTGPYGQVPYPQGPQQPGYPPSGPVQYAPDHPRATMSLVLGILGIVLCQVVAPFAWAMGRRTLNEIDASGGRVGGRGAAQAGYILGIVGTVLLVLGVIAIVIYVIVMIAVVGGGVATSGY